MYLRGNPISLVYAFPDSQKIESDVTRVAANLMTGFGKNYIVSGIIDRGNLSNLSNRSED